MKEYPPKTHGVALIAALFFAILLASCEQPKKNAAPSAKTATTETVTTAETAAVPAEKNSTSAPPEPTVADIVALSNAMHGAANQQPDDAPKDQYGEPYIIGNLGGFPVNLPASVVSLVEFHLVYFMAIMYYWIVRKTLCGISRKIVCQTAYG